MIDEVFIKTILQRGKEAKEKVQSEFSGLSLQQLNWKALPGSWSIAQCLEHLMISHGVYFPALKKITERAYEMSFWERYSPFTGICGRMLKSQLQEQPNKKFIAPKIIRPTSTEIKEDILEKYGQSLDTFLNYISSCTNIDIDKTIITSPAVQIVTYSLRDTFQFLIQHEHRHINQAMRIKGNNHFPQNIPDYNSTSANIATDPYDKNVIKKKILDIKTDIGKIIQPICPERFFIDWYGAYDINPKHLVYWVCVQSDNMKYKLAGNVELMAALRAVLENNDYPAESQKHVHIGFESQETVNRESKGNWYYHFK